MGFIEMVSMNKKHDFGVGMKGVFLAVLVAMILNACAIAPGVGAETRGDASAEVKGLAQSRWDALVRGDVTAAYGYLSPASKGLVSLVQYQQSIRVGFWKQAVVETVTCEPEICKVGVKITYDYKNVKGIETSVSESWVRDDGKWWFVLKQ